MEKGFEYGKEREQIQAQEKQLESLRKEANVLSRTLEVIKACEVKDDDLIQTYEAKLKENYEKQEKAEAASKLSKMKCLANLRQGIKERREQIEADIRDLVVLCEPLRKAVIADDPVAVAEALKDPLVDPKCRFEVANVGQMTAFHIAAMFGYNAALTALLADPRVDRLALTSRFEDTALHLAAYNGHLSTCQQLLPLISPHIRDKVRKCPYIIASGRWLQAESEAEKLKFRAIMDFLREPTFIAACQAGDLSLVKMTVDDGVNVNADNSQGLWHACLEQHITVMNYLLGLCRFDVNTRGSPTGRTILHEISRPEYKSRVDVQVDKKTQIPGRLYVMMELIKKGASVNLRDNTGATPLGTAIAYRAPDVVRFLAENGADLTLKYSLPSYPDIEATALDLARRADPEIYKDLRKIMMGRGFLLNELPDDAFNRSFLFPRNTNPKVANIHEGLHPPAMSFVK